MSEKPMTCNYCGQAYHCEWWYHATVCPGQAPMVCECGRRIHENFGDTRMYYGRYNHVDEDGQRDSKHYWHKAEPAEPVAEPPEEMKAAFEKWWDSLTLKGDPMRIPDKFIMSFEAGWRAALEGKRA